jgi:hypothetical protein
VIVSTGVPEHAGNVMLFVGEMMPGASGEMTEPSNVHDPVVRGTLTRLNSQRTNEIDCGG